MFWSRSNLCRFKATQWECDVWTSPHPKSGWDISPSCWGKSVFKARCKQWILANPFSQNIMSTHNLHHTLQEILFKQITLWDIKCPRTLIESLRGSMGTCHIDNVLVYGASQAEHDASLRMVLKRIETAQLRKMFGRDRVKTPDQPRRHKSRFWEDCSHSPDESTYQCDWVTQISLHDQPAGEVLHSNLRTIPTSQRVVQY